ncbi:GNAT family N-acetyltransferase [Metapseudomonas resinovorans]|uniref:Putative N(6)-hydroxylysine O-acetyltransferase n=1 Tax=Metapseudomonas resinovorans NBRC 106553 TaxID=1245471 RepID=S6AW89_METRE|nr:GNAT family N-acetyltransferase [Pseudomonas resinovorans]BAN48816.1 putative N(6)-hydroxylysine O-acetyltransferase [Pseudomonas resinovorans NBRC 106553]
MSHPEGLHRLPLPGTESLSIQVSPGRLTLLRSGQPLAQVATVEEGGTTLFHLQEARDGEAEAAIRAFCYWHFAANPEQQRLAWRLESPAVGAVQQGLLLPGANGLLQAERSLFWQLPAPWLRAAQGNNYPQLMVMSPDGRRHPLRAPKASGEVYRRFDARLGSWISLRTLDIDLDLERFNRWQNNPRVLEFWQEGGSLEQHRDYLQKLADDPHTLTLIGCFDDQPFAYFEAYWAKEDRIAPFYAVDDYDRGIHMLVGEESHRGPHKVASWLSALVHYLFLDDSRTRKVVAEPRADNARMIAHMQGQGFYREKEFDFPHKRAALMAVEREWFFDRCELC